MSVEQLGVKTAGGMWLLSEQEHTQAITLRKRVEELEGWIKDIRQIDLAGKEGAVVTILCDQALGGAGGEGCQSG